MRQFRWRITICLIPVLLGAIIVARAYHQYEKGEGGFKLGVDLVGGTILVYEVDDPMKLPENYKPEELAASLKRRIDPTDLYNVTVRPVGRTRVEIILPTGGRHLAELQQHRWQELLDAVRAKWPPPAGASLDVPQGSVAELVNRLRTQQPELSAKELQEFIDGHYHAGDPQLSGEDVQRIKGLIAQVGSLEFRILANPRDDEKAIKAAEEYIGDPKHKETLDRLAREGQPPPPPPTDGKAFDTAKGQFAYSWVELGRQERHDLDFDNAAENDARPCKRWPPQSRAQVWQEVAKARAAGKALRSERLGQVLGGALLYSRPVESLKMRREEAERKKYEYFVLTRDPERDPVTGEPKAITGKYLVNATAGVDDKLSPAVHFRFDSTGGDLFYDVTSRNLPEGPKGSQFQRHLAILLDGQIVSAPSIISSIRTDGQISGSFTPKEVDQLVSVLRSGALPATLKPQPVSESTMGATLGSDTIRSGSISVVLAFLAVLVFMIIYYRFAGMVASIALLANLLLTVGFMVAVNATFTLPGLAGLVLMLGMAVDANVLIYERLREERDRGASLALAIRNGYDRAFPTIIDTHLSSIFTAVVLYAVGNDQLKGFGISLTVGLIISLFTSLYMTRLLFDIWMARNWLPKLSMLRFFSRPNIDFMGIRYYWFTATVILTIFGITIFLLRGKSGLNIDFVGGTAYGGQLVKAIDIGDLRELLDEKRHAERLQISGVRQLDREGRSFEIGYSDGKMRTVDLPNSATPEEVRQRASKLPDLSVEQIFLSAPEYSEGNKSRFFTVRTSEKAPELVQAAVDRLLGESLQKVELKSFQIDQNNKGASLEFTELASPAQVRMLMEREFRAKGVAAQAEQFGLAPVGEGSAGRFQKMRLELTEPIPRDKLTAVLETTKQELAARPQPERLENFDSQLAVDTQLRAMYAILASWGAILLYLWFRFGNWTFGLAAVLCLVHDLCFTLGIIALCHYIHQYVPGLAGALWLQDFKIDLPAVAALLTLVGYSVNDTIVVFDRIREVRGKNPMLTPQMINDSVNQTLSRTLLASLTTWLVVIVLYLWGGDGVHLFAFVMVVGVIVGTYSSIYIASPLLLIFGEGKPAAPTRERKLKAEGAVA